MNQSNTHKSQFGKVGSFALLKQMNPKHFFPMPETFLSLRCQPPPERAALALCPLRLPLHRRAADQRRLGPHDGPTVRGRHSPGRHQAASGQQSWAPSVFL